jgi:hypothetical protein
MVQKGTAAVPLPVSLHPVTRSTYSVVTAGAPAALPPTTTTTHPASSNSEAMVRKRFRARISPRSGAESQATPGIDWQAASAA